MNIFQIILIVVFSLSGFPLGLFLAHHTKDELKAGKRWFMIIILLAALGAIISLIFTQGESLFFLLAVLFFIFLMALASWIKAKR